MISLQNIEILASKLFPIPDRMEHSMPLDTSTIKSRLAAAEWKVKDNEAQKLINDASPGELFNLNAEGVLRLYEALAMLQPRIYSDNDKAAMKKLALNSQFQPIVNSPGISMTPDYGVNLIRNARQSIPIIQEQLSVDLVLRIYAAEDSRLSFLERYIKDGETIGRGQLGQPSYTDVKSASGFRTELETCLTRVFISNVLARYRNPWATVKGFDMATYMLVVPEQYKDIYNENVAEDMVVAGYLALKLTAAAKPKRSSKDAARFAVAVYHGMREMVFKAQTEVNDSINWAPVEAELLKKGYQDEVAYVNEVVPK
jgi:hypothetical protein